jgi:two-component system phosphate regulon response regulator PhoB
MTSTIIAVHRDERLRASTRATLTLAGHAVQEAEDLGAAWRVSENIRPDLILVPWVALPPVREALARLRDSVHTRHTRAIVWAAHDDMHDAVNALEFGADDCLGIPFDAAELVARVNACLRRPPAAAKPDQLTAGPIVLDKGVHCLLVKDQLVDLAPTEFRLMAFFLENQGRVFSRDELLRRAWSKHIKAGHRTVDVHVRRLRQVLEPFACEDMIQTVRGFGYRFAALAVQAGPRKREQRPQPTDRP